MAFTQYYKQSMYVAVLAITIFHDCQPFVTWGTFVEKKNKLNLD